MHTKSAPCARQVHAKCKSGGCKMHGNDDVVEVAVVADDVVVVVVVDFVAVVVVVARGVVFGFCRYCRYPLSRLS